MRTFLRAIPLMAISILLPASAFAQASIAGSTRDSSGGVLPGVSVEASSPALIEKVRTAVTDDRGLFRIVSLPPGTYSITFVLPGFNQVRRDGIELSGSFTAQIDTVLAVGGVAETVTVNGRDWSGCSSPSSRTRSSRPSPKSSRERSPSRVSRRSCARRRSVA